MQTYDEILARIRATLVQLFELPTQSVRPEARLLEDLEIDSIDVVDLMEHMRKFTGRKVTATDFRSVHTVDDLVQVVQRLLSS